MNDMDRNNLHKRHLDLIRSCEEGLRCGRVGEVARLLAGVNAARIPRELRLPLAQLARRTESVALGLKILRPVMPDENSGAPGDASNEEFAEYGVLLQQVGSLSEAFRHLDRVAVEKVPKVLLYKSFCHFNQWEYPQAKPLLARYVGIGSLTDYERIIGEINYASCLVATRDSAAEPLLKKLIATAKNNGYGRLHGNALEMLSQLAIATGNWGEARQLLQTAERLLGKASATDIYYVQKWKCVLEALETGDCTSLLNFREEVFRLGHWESVREADFYLMKVRQDENLFHYLYAGTPFQEYRKKIMEAVGERWAPERIFELGDDGPVFDLSACAFEEREVLKPGQRPHSLLLALFSDFYRPCKTATLFSEVFAGQAFVIPSSPSRIYQAVRTTRKLLTRAGIDLSIDEKNGSYRFSLAGSLRVRFAVERGKDSREEFLLRKLDVLFRDGEFTARQARNVLGIPLTSFHRWMGWAMQAGRLLKIGSGSNVRYRLARFETRELAA